MLMLSAFAFFLTEITKNQKKMLQESKYSVLLQPHLKGMNRF